MLSKAEYLMPIIELHTIPDLSWLGESVQ